MPVTSFFEWVRPEPVAESYAVRAVKVTAITEPATKLDQPKQEPLEPEVKLRPRFPIDAVTLLANDTSEGKLGRGMLGQYLKRTDPAFSPKAYGHSGLIDLVRTDEPAISAPVVPPRRTPRSARASARAAGVRTHRPGADRRHNRRRSFFCRTKHTRGPP